MKSRHIKGLNNLMKNKNWHSNYLYFKTVSTPTPSSVNADNVDDNSSALTMFDFKTERPVLQNAVNAFLGQLNRLRSSYMPLNMRDSHVSLTVKPANHPMVKRYDSHVNVMEEVSQFIFGLSSKKTAEERLDAFKNAWINADRTVAENAFMKIGGINENQSKEIREKLKTDGILDDQYRLNPGVDLSTLDIDLSEFVTNSGQYKDTVNNILQQSQELPGLLRLANIIEAQRVNDPIEREQIWNDKVNKQLVGARLEQIVGMYKNLGKDNSGKNLLSLAIASHDVFKSVDDTNHVLYSVKALMETTRVFKKEDFISAFTDEKGVLDKKGLAMFWKRLQDFSDYKTVDGIVLDEKKKEGITSFLSEEVSDARRSAIGSIIENRRLLDRYENIPGYDEDIFLAVMWSHQLQGASFTDGSYSQLMNFVVTNDPNLTETQQKMKEALSRILADDNKKAMFLDLLHVLTIIDTAGATKNGFISENALLNLDEARSKISAVLDSFRGLVSDKTNTETLPKQLEDQALTPAKMFKAIKDAMKTENGVDRQAYLGMMRNMVCMYVKHIDNAGLRKRVEDAFNAAVVDIGEDVVDDLIGNAPHVIEQSYINTYSAAMVALENGVDIIDETTGMVDLSKLDISNLRLEDTIKAVLKYNLLFVRYSKLIQSNDCIATFAAEAFNVNFFTVAEADALWDKTDAEFISAMDKVFKAKNITVTVTDVKDDNGVFDSDAYYNSIDIMGVAGESSEAEELVNEAADGDKHIVAGAKVVACLAVAKQATELATLRETIMTAPKADMSLGKTLDEYIRVESIIRHSSAKITDLGQEAEVNMHRLSAFFKSIQEDKFFSVDKATAALNGLKNTKITEEELLEFLRKNEIIDSNGVVQTKSINDIKTEDLKKGLNIVNDSDLEMLKKALNRSLNESFADTRITELVNKRLSLKTPNYRPQIRNQFFETYCKIFLFLKAAFTVVTWANFFLAVSGMGAFSRVTSFMFAGSMTYFTAMDFAYTSTALLDASRKWESLLGEIEDRDPANYMAMIEGHNMMPSQFARNRRGWSNRQLSHGPLSKANFQAGSVDGFSFSNIRPAHDHHREITKGQFLNMLIRKLYKKEEDTHYSYYGPKLDVDGDSWQIRNLALNLGLEPIGESTVELFSQSYQDPKFGFDPSSQGQRAKYSAFAQFLSITNHYREGRYVTSLTLTKLLSDMKDELPENKDQDTAEQADRRKIIEAIENKFRSVIEACELKDFVKNATFEEILSSILLKEGIPEASFNSFIEDINKNKDKRLLDVFEALGKQSFFKNNKLVPDSFYTGLDAVTSRAIGREFIEKCRGDIGGENVVAEMGRKLQAGMDLEPKEQALLIDAMNRTYHVSTEKAVEIIELVKKNAKELSEMSNQASGIAMPKTAEARKMRWLLEDHTSNKLPLENFALSRLLVHWKQFKDVVKGKTYDNKDVNVNKAALLQDLTSDRFLLDRLGELSSEKFGDKAIKIDDIKAIVDANTSDSGINVSAVIQQLELMIINGFPLKGSLAKVNEYKKKNKELISTDQMFIPIKLEPGTTAKIAAADPEGFGGRVFIDIIKGYYAPKKSMEVFISQIAANTSNLRFLNNFTIMNMTADIAAAVSRLALTAEDKEKIYKGDPVKGIQIANAGDLTYEQFETQLNIQHEEVVNEAIATTIRGFLKNIQKKGEVNFNNQKIGFEIADLKKQYLPDEIIEGIVMQLAGEITEKYIYEHLYQSNAMAFGYIQETMININTIDGLETALLTDRNKTALLSDNNPYYEAANLYKKTKAELTSSLEELGVLSKADHKEFSGKLSDLIKIIEDTVKISVSSGNDRQFHAYGDLLSYEELKELLIALITGRETDVKIALGEHEAIYKSQALLGKLDELKLDISMLEKKKVQNGSLNKEDHEALEKARKAAKELEPLSNLMAAIKTAIEDEIKPLLKTPKGSMAMSNLAASIDHHLDAIAAKERLTINIAALIENIKIDGNDVYQGRVSAEFSVTGLLNDMVKFLSEDDGGKIDEATITKMCESLKGNRANSFPGAYKMFTIAAKPYVQAFAQNIHKTKMTGETKPLGEILINLIDNGAFTPAVASIAPATADVAEVASKQKKVNDVIQWARDLNFIRVDMFQVQGSRSDSYGSKGGIWTSILAGGRQATQVGNVLLRIVNNAVASRVNGSNIETGTRRDISEKVVESIIYVGNDNATKIRLGVTSEMIYSQLLDKLIINKKDKLGVRGVVKDIMAGWELENARIYHGAKTERTAADLENILVNIAREMIIKNYSLQHVKGAAMGLQQLYLKSQDASYEVDRTKFIGKKEYERALEIFKNVTGVDLSKNWDDISSKKPTWEQLEAELKEYFSNLMQTDNEWGNIANDDYVKGQVDLSMANTLTLIKQDTVKISRYNLESKYAHITQGLIAQMFLRNAGGNVQVSSLNDKYADDINKSIKKIDSSEEINLDVTGIKAIIKQELDELHSKGKITDGDRRYVLESVNKSYHQFENQYLLLIQSFTGMNVAKVSALFSLKDHLAEIGIESMDALLARGHDVISIITGQLQQSKIIDEQGDMLVKEIPSNVLAEIKAVVEDKENYPDTEAGFSLTLAKDLLEQNTDSFEFRKAYVGAVQEDVNWGSYISDMYKKEGQNIQEIFQMLQNNLAEGNELLDGLNYTAMVDGKWVKGSWYTQTSRKDAFNFEMLYDSNIGHYKRTITEKVKGKYERKADQKVIRDWAVFDRPQTPEELSEYLSSKMSQDIPEKRLPDSKKYKGFSEPFMDYFVEFSQLLEKNTVLNGIDKNTSPLEIQEKMQEILALMEAEMSGLKTEVVDKNGEKKNVPKYDPLSQNYVAAAITQPNIYQDMGTTLTVFDAEGKERKVYLPADTMGSIDGDNNMMKNKSRLAQRYLFDPVTRQRYNRDFVGVQSPQTMLDRSSSDRINLNVAFEAVQSNFNKDRSGEPGATSARHFPCGCFNSFTSDIQDIIFYERHMQHQDVQMDWALTKYITRFLNERNNNGFWKTFGKAAFSPKITAADWIKPEFFTGSEKDIAWKVVRRGYRGTSFAMRFAVPIALASIAVASPGIAVSAGAVVVLAMFLAAKIGTGNWTDLRSYGQAFIAITPLVLGLGALSLNLPLALAIIVAFSTYSATNQLTAHAIIKENGISKWDIEKAGSDLLASAGAVMAVLGLSEITGGASIALNSIFPAMLGFNALLGISFNKARQKAMENDPEYFKNADRQKMPRMYKSGGNDKERIGFEGLIYQSRHKALEDSKGDPDLEANDARVDKSTYDIGHNGIDTDQRVKNGQFPGRWIPKFVADKHELIFWELARKSSFDRKLKTISALAYPYHFFIKAAMPIFLASYLLAGISSIQFGAPNVATSLFGMPMDFSLLFGLAGITTMLMGNYTRRRRMMDTGLPKWAALLEEMQQLLFAQDMMPNTWDATQRNPITRRNTGGKETFQTFNPTISPEGPLSSVAKEAKDFSLFGNNGTFSSSRKMQFIYSLMSAAAISVTVAGILTAAPATAIALGAILSFFSLRELSKHVGSQELITAGMDRSTSALGGYSDMNMLGSDIENNLDYGLAKFKNLYLCRKIMKEPRVDLDKPISSRKLSKVGG
ncbi:MAG: hypothetical protein PHF25_05845, partial [Candidatus Margulisbacteria bacterium]|nr:hypothetical protein [Candidatus Margulisiibacteriota bacterium]